MSALLTLERFDRLSAPPPPPRLAPEDVQAAFERGVQQGRAEAQDELVERLCRELAVLQAALTEQEASQARQRAQALAALRPLLEALFQEALPAAALARLQAALLVELDRLAGAAAPLRGAIRCGPDFAPFVAACLAQAGITGLVLDAAGAPGTVELSVQGGAILFDRGEAATRLRALIDEFLEEA